MSMLSLCFTGAHLESPDPNRHETRAVVSGLCLSLLSRLRLPAVENGKIVTIMFGNAVVVANRVPADGYVTVATHGDFVMHPARISWFGIICSISARRISTASSPRRVLNAHNVSVVGLVTIPRRERHASQNSISREHYAPGEDSLDWNIYVRACG